MDLPIDEAMLLAQCAWLRRLAGELVADTHRAEDAAQETWRVALERPPRTRRLPALRRWMRVVLQNVVRRSQHAEAARRWQEERAAGEREARLTATLRARLDRGPDGPSRDRDWRSAWIGWLRGEPAARALGTAVGVSWMTTKAKLAVAGIAVAGALFWIASSLPDGVLDERSGVAPVGAESRPPDVSRGRGVRSGRLGGGSRPGPSALGETLDRRSFEKRAGLGSHRRRANLAAAASQGAFRAGVSGDLESALVADAPVPEAMPEPPVLERVPAAMDEWTVDRERDLHGIVVDEVDAPVAGAAVRAHESDWSKGWALWPWGDLGERAVVGEARTDREGRFAIPLAAGRLYDLEVEARSFGRSWSLEHQAGARVVMRLAAAAAIAGRVVMETDGAGVPNATVHIGPHGPFESGPRFAVASARTDTDGSFRLAGLAPGRMSLLVDTSAGGVPSGTPVEAHRRRDVDGRDPRPADAIDPWPRHGRGDRTAHRRGRRDGPCPHPRRRRLPDCRGRHLPPRARPHA